MFCLVWWYHYYLNNGSPCTNLNVILFHILIAIYMSNFINLCWFEFKLESTIRPFSSFTKKSGFRLLSKTLNNSTKYLSFAIFLLKRVPFSGAFLYVCAYVWFSSISWHHSLHLDITYVLSYGILQMYHQTRLRSLEMKWVISSSKVFFSGRY